jgi:hypothetical protein
MNDEVKKNPIGRPSELLETLELAKKYLLIIDDFRSIAKPPSGYCKNMVFFLFFSFFFFSSFCFFYASLLFCLSLFLHFMFIVFFRFSSSPPSLLSF